MKKKHMIFVLVLSLVFSLTLSTVASALNVRDAGSYGIPEDEEIQRGLMWEELNNLVCEIDQGFLAENVTGNYFTSNYVNALKSARDYAQYLLDSVSSTYAELSEMASELRYMIEESKNPANHELAFHYTVAFTDTQGWGDPVYVYAWSSSGIGEFVWPGQGVISSYLNEFGQKQYFAYIGEEYDYVIFSSKSGAQTADIPLYDKTGYYPTGEVDTKGNYKVNSWHITDPRYKTYEIPTEPTEPAETISDEPEATTPSSPFGDIPRFSPDDPDEGYIDWYLPKYDTEVKLKIRTNESELYTQLYSLIIDTDRMISAPGNSFDQNYVERVKRTRSFSVSVYNHDRNEDHELIGAIRSLQMAVEGESYGRIVDCLRYYFIYADEYEPTQATEPTEPPKPTEDDPLVDYIDRYLPKFDEDVRLRNIPDGREVFIELGSLIAEADRKLFEPNDYDEGYAERIRRTRNFAATVYNCDYATERELTGAIKALELALDGLNYYAIVNCLRAYFEYPENEDEYVPGVVSVRYTDAADAPSVESLLDGFEIESIKKAQVHGNPLYYVYFKEKTMEIVWRAIDVLRESEYISDAFPEAVSPFAQGEVLVSLKTGSASTIREILEDFEIEDIRLITPGSNMNIYHITFKEKTKDIVWSAIGVLSASPCVEAADPNYYGFPEVIDDEESYNQTKDELEEEAFSIEKAGDAATGSYRRLNRLIIAVRHSVYDLNGIEFVPLHWIEKMDLLSHLKNAIKVYKASSSSEAECQRAFEALNTAYLAFVPPFLDKRGDADGDGKVTVLDATTIQKVLASVMTDTDGMIAYRGDVTGDRLDITDATAIQKHLAGFVNTYQIEDYLE